MNLFFSCRYDVIIILLLLNGYVSVRAAAVGKAADGYEGFVLVDIEQDGLCQNSPVHNGDAYMQAVPSAVIPGSPSQTVVRSGELPVVCQIEVYGITPQDGILPGSGHDGALLACDQVGVVDGFGQVGTLSADEHGGNLLMPHIPESPMIVHVGGQGGESLGDMHGAQLQAMVPRDALPAANQAKVSPTMAIASRIVASRGVTTNAFVDDFNSRTKLPNGRMSPIGPMSPTSQALSTGIVWPVFCADNGITNQDGVLGRECACRVIADEAYDVSGCCVHGAQGLAIGQGGVPALPSEINRGVDPLHASQGDAQAAQARDDGSAHAQLVQYCAQAVIIATTNVSVEPVASNALPASDALSDVRRRSKSHDAALLGATLSCSHIEKEQMDRAATPGHDLEKRSKRRSRRSMSYGSIPRSGQSIAMEHPCSWDDEQSSQDGNVKNGQDMPAASKTEHDPQGGINNGQPAAQPSPTQVEREPRRCGMRHCCLL